MTQHIIDDSTGFDEPAEQTAAAPSTTSKAALAITDDISRIGTAVSEFDRVAAGLADIEARFPKDVVYDLTTTKGMKAALEHRAAWRDPRITVEKVRKMAKAPLIALGKNIDARAAWLTERLLEGETPIDQQIKVEEARREAEREAKAAAEFGRVLAIQEALAAIGIDVAAACGKTSADIAALLELMKTTEPDPAKFQEMLEQAKAAWAAGIAKLETAHKAKLWEEAEQRREAEEREAQRIAQQKADEERARVAAEQAAEAARLAAERAEIERQRAELQAMRDAAAAAEREEAERQSAELQEARRRAEEAEARATQQPAPAPAPATEVVAIRPAPAANEAATMSLGAINQRLGLTVSADFLASLGFEAHKERAARLYRPSDFPAICAGISAHVLAAAAEHQKDA